MTKSPYEIRLDVLQLAKDMIDKNNCMPVTTGVSILNTSYRTTTTTEEIIARATELYSFVNNNKL